MASNNNNEDNTLLLIVLFVAMVLVFGPCTGTFLGRNYRFEITEAPKATDTATVSSN